MRRLITQRNQDNEEIDLTPMLDVVFIMLIFFIVTATFVKEIGLDVGHRRVGRFPLIAASSDYQAVDAPELHICCANT